MALSRRDVELAVDLERRRERDVCIAAELALPQRAREALELELAGGTFLFDRAVRAHGEVDRAGPVFRERARIDSLRIRLDVPAQFWLEHDIAGRVQDAVRFRGLRLRDIELGERDLVGRAGEFERDVRDLLRRPDAELAGRGEFLRVAARGYRAVRRERLADEIGGQLDVGPCDRRLAADRLRIEMHLRLRGQRADRFG